MISRGNRFLKLTVYYLAAWLDGICIILLPASSFIFKSLTMNGITDQQYGFSFFPMNLAAILITVNFQVLLRRFGKEKIFYAGLFFHFLYGLFVISMSLALGRPALSFSFLLGANFMLGIGFGLLLSILNIYIVDLFTKKRDTFVTGLHSMVGAGAAMAPLLVSFFARHGFWSYSALFAVFAVTLITILAYMGGVTKEGGDASGPVRHRREDAIRKPGPLAPIAVLFIVTTVFYGVAEAILGNWTAVYLTQDKGFSIQTASLALSFFWFFMTVGRVTATFLTLVMHARFLYRLSPIVIVTGLLMIVFIRGEDRILAAYMTVGLGCSYFFPLTISLATEYFDQWREILPPLIVAGLMTGVFIGSFLVGFFRDHSLLSLSGAFLGAALSAGTAGLFALFLTRRKVPATFDPVH